MKNILPIIAIALIFAGCTEQRDIYTTASPSLYIRCDWGPSLHTLDMSMNATAMIYKEHEQQAPHKEYFLDPNSIVVPLSKGKYDVLLFSGLMYSETDTHLDGIYFRSTDQLESFEAVAKEAAPNNRLSRASDDYLATNDMEILISGYKEQEMENEVSYHLKYKNGKNGIAVTPEDYIEVELLVTPFAVSYKCQVIVKLINASSVYVANGALRGFARSVFMASRMPSHLSATHQFRLNSFKLTGDNTGTIESPVFVTFGPPLDLPDREYMLEVSIVLINGEEYYRNIDITSQIFPVIEKIRKNINISEPIEIDLTIPIEIELTLPEVTSGSGSIGVDDWEDDEIIKVPIGRK